MKQFMLFAVALVTLTLFSCSDDDDNDSGSGSSITNTMVLRGQTYPIEIALYFAHEDGQNGKFYNLDCDTKGGGLHGYGGFEGALVGKTTPLKGRFFLSFNPQSGPSIDPVIESGSVTIKQVSDGLHILVDCKEEGGEKFTMNFLAKDEEKMRQ